jgi:hypothetical protein
MNSKTAKNLADGVKNKKFMVTNIEDKREEIKHDYLKKQ